MSQHFDRRLTPARPDLAAAHLTGIVTAQRYVQGEVMRFGDEVTELLPEPRRDLSIDTQALYGEEVVVYDRDEEGWSWVQLSRDGYVGYVSTDSLHKLDQPTHRVSALRTLVYPGPSIKIPHWAALPLGALVHVHMQSGDFVQVAGLGYIWRDHLSTLDHFESDYVTVAERFLHVPYLWGGKTSLGIDCSGLVQVSLQACGIEAPRDTDMMEGSLGSALAMASDCSGLKRGDLVFWKGHVGIMQDATRLLHANGTFMQVTSEPLAIARERIRAKTGGDITSLRRL